MMNSKNFGLSAASMDLGLGDQLKQQLDDNDEERKKKLLRQANSVGGMQTALPQSSPAAMSLGITNG